MKKSLLLTGFILLLSAHAVTAQANAAPSACAHDQFLDEDSGQCRTPKNNDECAATNSKTPVYDTRSGGCLVACPYSLILNAKTGQCRSSYSVKTCPQGLGRNRYGACYSCPQGRERNKYGECDGGTSICPKGLRRKSSSLCLAPAPSSSPKFYSLFTIDGVTPTRSRKFYSLSKVDDRTPAASHSGVQMWINYPSNFNAVGYARHIREADVRGHYIFNNSSEPFVVNRRMEFKSSDPNHFPGNIETIGIAINRARTIVIPPGLVAYVYGSGSTYRVKLECEKHGLVEVRVPGHHFIKANSKNVCMEHREQCRDYYVSIPGLPRLQNEIDKICAAPAACADGQLRDGGNCRAPRTSDECNSTNSETPIYHGTHGCLVACADDQIRDDGNGNCRSPKTNDECNAINAGTPIYDSAHGCLVACASDQVRGAENGDCRTPKTNDECAAINPGMPVYDDTHGCLIACASDQVRDANTGDCLTPQTACTSEQIRDADTGNCRAPQNNDECATINSETPVYHNARGCLVACADDQIRDDRTSDCRTPQSDIECASIDPETPVYNSNHGCLIACADNQLYDFNTDNCRTPQNNDECTHVDAGTPVYDSTHGCLVACAFDKIRDAGNGECRQPRSDEECSELFPNRPVIIGGVCGARIQVANVCESGTIYDPSNNSCRKPETNIECFLSSPDRPVFRDGICVVSCDDTPLVGDVPDEAGTSCVCPSGTDVSELMDGETVCAAPLPKTKSVTTETVNVARRKLMMNAPLLTPELRFITALADVLSFVLSTKSVMPKTVNVDSPGVTRNAANSSPTDR